MAWGWSVDGASDLGIERGDKEGARTENGVRRQSLKLPQKGGRVDLVHGFPCVSEVFFSFR